MKMHVFAIYDSAAGYFMQPFVDRSVGSAMRGFENACRGDEMPNAVDFELYKLAEYDDVTGEFSENTPEVMMRGREVIAGDFEVREVGNA